VKRLGTGKIDEDKLTDLVEKTLRELRPLESSKPSICATNLPADRGGRFFKMAGIWSLWSGMSLDLPWEDG
jgi:hypothetical protein